MIADISPWTVIRIPNTTQLSKAVQWTELQGLTNTVDWEYYGRDDRNKIAFGFREKRTAMLFKLTFGGQ